MPLFWPLPRLNCARTKCLIEYDCYLHLKSGFGFLTLMIMTSMTLDLIAEFESQEAAQAWADADPYVAAGVYAKVTVRPYKKVF